MSYPLLLSLLQYLFPFHSSTKPRPSYLHAPGLVDHFDIHPSTGFLPISPLSSLPNDYDLWESALASAHHSLSLGEDTSPEALAKRESSRQWRLHLQNAPILDTKPLHTDIPLLQRAHHVLAFLVHFYVHSIPPSPTPDRITVPASLAVPLVAISDVLGIAPILTFADTVLWNWSLKDPSQPVSTENMRCQTLFSNTADEEGFYLCCANIELHGVKALGIILDYMNAPLAQDDADLARVSGALDRLTGIIDELNDILRSVRSTCDPHTFYFHIRPWFRGSDADGAESLGWIYQGIDPSRHLELSGPSAGQSTVIHALDIFLDVDHQLKKPRVPAPSEHNRRADQSFMVRMRQYMPGKHQAFLAHISTTQQQQSHLSVRELAKIHRDVLRPSYDAVVLALKRFRDQHMRIACLYIVSMSRSAAARAAGCPMRAVAERLEREASGVRLPIRGTGGNELSCLLKASRDATTRTVISGNIN